MSKAQLYMKMLNVMQAIDYLQKDDQVAFGQTKYKAISEEKVTMTVREQLIKNKLIVFPVEQSHSREGTLSTVDVKYKIVDAETGEYEILVSSGTGADTQDKGVGKAMTYSFKYLFLRTFAIPTGEDPDKISSDELDAKQVQDAEKRQASQEKQLKDIKTKWQLLAGDLNGFEDYYNKKIEEGATPEQIHSMLAKKLMDSRKKGA